MNNELRFPDPARDRDLAADLEPLLTPPMDTPAYWAGLHGRIMARVSQVAGPAAWWNISPTVARAGMLAAGLALLALGALALQAREIEARMAFQSVTEIPLEVARIIPGVDEPLRRPGSRR
jgi:hypothetical protein